MLRWPLYQQRRPSISRQDQYSLVAGLARHWMVSALAVGKANPKAILSAIITRVTLLNVVSLSVDIDYETNALQSDAERVNELFD